ncbi:hypothetical protein [Jatrophihabitans sp.]|uniref:hypothetical protein n=1 Tax=Jatrophihabitans sp. TaxID=1932789 RepID=UPI002BDFE802|nr:hypothetical protein [Jatrophihabitans sp.]
MRHSHAVGPWGQSPDLPGWLAAGDFGPDQPATPELPNLIGFAKSPFLNLTRHTMAECLAGWHPGGDQPAALGIVLASVLGDLTSADQASRSVAAGEVPVPMLFYQSVPVSVLGRLSIEFPLSGPLICLSGGPELCESALECAESMLADDGLEAVLVGYTEAGQDRWRPAAARTLAELWGQPVVPDWDCAVSLLLEPGPPATAAPAEPAGRDQLPAPLRDFLGMAEQSQISEQVGAST